MAASRCLGRRFCFSGTAITALGGCLLIAGYLIGAPPAAASGKPPPKPEPAQPSPEPPETYWSGRLDVVEPEFQSYRVPFEANAAMAREALAACDFRRFHQAMDRLRKATPTDVQRMSFSIEVDAVLGSRWRSLDRVIARATPKELARARALKEQLDAFSRAMYTTQVQLDRELSEAHRRCDEAKARQSQGPTVRDAIPTGQRQESFFDGTVPPEPPTKEPATHPKDWLPPKPPMPAHEMEPFGGTLPPEPPSSEGPPTRYTPEEVKQYFDGTVPPEPPPGDANPKRYTPDEIRQYFDGTVPPEPSPSPSPPASGDPGTPRVDIKTLRTGGSIGMKELRLIEPTPDATPLPPKVSDSPWFPKKPSCCERCPHRSSHERYYNYSQDGAPPQCNPGDAAIVEAEADECWNTDPVPWVSSTYGDRCCAGKQNQVRYDTVPSGSVKSDVGSTLRSACDADPCTGKVESAPGSPRRVETSILSTGPDIHGRDWVPEHPILKLGKDRLKPCHTEPFYVTKEATMQGAAKAVFTAMGLEHDAERAEASKGSACQGGGSHESATERAAKSAALGLLATQMKGQMKGLRAMFDVTGREEAARDATLQADIVNAVTQRRERLSLPMRFHADEAAQ